MLPRLATFVSRMTSIVVLPDSMLVGIRQQRQEARALHGDSELPLVKGLRAGDAARHDLARLGDVSLERGEVLVVDVLHAFGGEAAEFLATGEAAVSAATTTTTATTIIRFHGHVRCSPVLSVVDRAVVIRTDVVVARGALTTRRTVVTIIVIAR